MGHAERYVADDVGKRELAKMAWMALMLTPGMGPTRIWKEMGRLGAAERLFDASLTELEGLGMPAAAAQFCFEGKARGRRLRMR
jgi:DNA processing protein